MNRFDIALNKKPKTRDNSGGMLSLIQESFLNGIIWTIEHQKADPLRMRERLNPAQIKRDFQTLRVGLPRGIGKSSLVRNLAKHFRNSIIIVPFENMRKDFRQTSPVYCPSHDLIGCRASYVIVDEVSLINNEMMQVIYAINAEFFILIG
jgi:predicted AAA+ superfamily ATPase